MKDNLVGEIIGVLGILIGIVVSYYFYYKSKREKSPCWAIKNNNLISGFESDLIDLQVLYKGENIKNLSISKVLFWNDGNETINIQDLETINPLRLVSKEDVNILDVKILQTNNLSNNFSIKFDEFKNDVLIKFDYLDKNQGCIIQVFHSGISSKDISIVGDIKGVKVINKKLLVPNWIKSVQKLNLLKFLDDRKTAISFGMKSGFLYVLIGILLLFFSILMNKSIIVNSSLPHDTDLIFFAIFLIATGAFMFYISFSMYKTLKISPKGLEKFE